MKRSVKLITLLVVVLLALPPLTAIAQDGQVKLRVIGLESIPEERETPLAIAKQEVITRFEAAHPEVDIESLEAPPEFDTQLLVDLAAGTAPDVWYQDASTA